MDFDIADLLPGEGLVCFVDLDEVVVGDPTRHIFISVVFASLFGMVYSGTLVVITGYGL